jgi:tol-pal system protein YbgF
MLVLFAASAAYPQRKEVLQLTADMIMLQQQMKQLQTSVDQNNAVLKGIVEKMADQVSGLAGGMDRVSKSVDAAKTQDDKSLSEFRLILTNLNTDVKELQETLSAIRTQLNSVSQQVTTMKTTAEPLSGPEDLMRAAAADALAGNYDLAASGYMEFIQMYPDHPRAAEAHLGLADTFMNQKKFAQAIPEYDFFLQKYPESDKTRTALYKKGLALVEQNQPQQAITILNDVQKRFPNTTEALSAQAKVRELRQPAARPAAR